MNSTAKSLIIKAQDNLDLAKRFIDDDNQHNVAGYNLAQAAEHFLKSLLVMRELEFPEDEEAHDLDALMQVLEEDNMSAISSHADVIDLTPYNSLKANIGKGQRLNLHEYVGHVENLKNLVKSIVM